MSNKLGVHAIKTTPEAIAFAKVAPVVKAIDNLDVLKVARPDAIQLFRHYFAVQDFTTPRTAAEAIIAALAGYRHPNLYVETYNEVGKADRDRYIWFLLTAVPLLQAAGLKVAGPSWSTGDYEQADWDAFRAAHWCGFSLLDLHAYWGSHSFTEWHALRYRTYWRPGDPNIVISEAGRDKVEGGLGGWKKDGLTAAQYTAELVAYAHETAKDPYVVGVTPFSSGPTNDWLSFTIDPLTTTLIQSLGYGDTPMPPTPPKPPAPTPALDVGTGVLAEMAKRNDHPVTKENYKNDNTGQTYASETYGTLGRYDWIKTTGQIYYFPRSLT